MIVRDDRGVARARPGPPAAPVMSHGGDTLARGGRYVGARGLFVCRWPGVGRRTERGVAAQALARLLRPAQAAPGCTQSAAVPTMRDWTALWTALWTAGRRTAQPGCAGRKPHASRARRRDRIRRRWQRLGSGRRSWRIVSAGRRYAGGSRGAARRKARTGQCGRVRYVPVEPRCVAAQRHAGCRPRSRPRPRPPPTSAGKPDGRSGGASYECC